MARPRITKDDLTNELESFIREHNRLPKRREFGHEVQIKNLFGSFNQFIESCGYEPNPSAAFAESLIGKRFGRLVVISKSDKTINRQSTWNCLCDCGNAKNDILRGLLTSGQTRSCGCLHQESFKNLEKREELQVEGTMLSHLSDKPLKNNKTGVRGVYFNNRRQKYVATIEFKGERHHLGYFDKLHEAAVVREEAEKKYFYPILKKYEQSSIKGYNNDNDNEVPSKGRKNQYTDDFLIQAIRNLADKTKTRPKSREFPHRSTAILRFGTWKNFLLVAKIIAPNDKMTRSIRWTDEFMQKKEEAYKDYLIKSGKKPSSTIAKNEIGIHGDLIVRKYGNWKNFNKKISDDLQKD